ncbi:membrane protein insertase YidC [Anaerobaca lacustris]|uniref:Membrane protein insertase YidC n=1 Tax=Anaerobaca lacustris TaxID=3044600 RepID=A0AAW6TZI2_9BACT|nr:membrane protein insertase YidC [Sedimentisphaerales bacterium M17dextr]
MSLRTSVALVLVCFCLLCGGLIVESAFRATPSSDVAASPSARRGLLLLQQTAEIDAPGSPQTPAAAQARLQPATSEVFGAVGGPSQRLTIGSVDPRSGFKFQLELDSQGAAIRTATFSEFKDRDHKDPQPLVFLSPVQLSNGREMLSMANKGLVLVDQNRQLSLDALSWRTLGAETTDAGGRTVSFEATITDAQDRPFLRLTRTYHVQPDSYLVESTLTIDNLSGGVQNVRYDLRGPLGLEREAFRQDMRGAIGGFQGAEGQVVRSKIEWKNLAKAAGTPLPIEAKNGGGPFLWAAAVNKYFAAILVPVPDANDAYVDWIAGRTGRLYNPDGDAKADTGDETIGLDFSVASTTLNPGGQAGSSRTYSFQLYLGPKDKSLFDKNELYKRLGFVQTIDFMGCCCPASIINPLAFGILAIMKGMYAVIQNYGIVIIILVFLMRLIMHPITKKSQVSMSRMSQLAPRAEEIKKKYANNKQEMNKRLMELYREQGASPIMGFLPMLVQMPIWIALWSAVYTSIDLRGAAFLPFWITDLSMPDALIRWSPFTIPLLGWKVASLNVLPLLMGVAFYLQQKLMPTQANAATNPQMAQQQKMMMIMMPLLFPLMLYNGPSGVNLYIMASTFAGVIEQHVIRKHIRQREAAEAQGLVAVTTKTGGKVKKKKPKPFYKF